MTVAVCYFASTGYLFQTAVSAMQARRFSPSTVPVFVVFVTGSTSSEIEAAAFETVLRRHGVTLLRLDASALDGWNFMFGRFFVESVLPDAVDRILYLDGDTQVLDRLDPLLAATPSARGVLACRDPMVLLREVAGRHRAKIDRWWDQSEVPEATRGRYVNSGVFLTHREFFSELRREVLDFAKTHPGLVFGDQDALNIVMGKRIELVSACWNFPGFLLGTAVERVTPPRLVHFMSQPRPWDANLRPWGRAFYQPYVELAGREPTLAPYWRRLGRSQTLRYVAQQTYKGIVERPALLGPQVEETARALERTIDVRT